MQARVAWIALILTLMGAGISGYKILVLGYPLSPPAEEIWRLQCFISFQGTGAPAFIHLALPTTSQRHRILDESIQSGGLRFSIALRELDRSRTGTWWSPALNRSASVTYQALIRMSAGKVKPLAVSGQVPATLESFLVTSPLPPDIDAAVTAVLKQVQSQTPSPLEQARVLHRLLRSTTPAEGWTENDLQLLREVTVILKDRNRTYLELVRRLQIPARRVIGFPLVRGFVLSERTWAEVWAEERWHAVDVERGHFSFLPSQYLRLAATEDHLLRGEGVKDLNWRCLISQAVQSQYASFIGKILTAPGILNQWSLYHLPLELQEVFRVLLLVPLGALVVAITRNMIGLPTFGTFMPILLAIAFRGTLLGYGIVMLLLLILAGAVVRFLVDRLRLLLVPRLAVILSVIIVLMAFFSLVGERMGIARLMAVSLLPMVILTMTVERFFVVWQESGTRIAFQTLAGTLAVAALGYLILSSEPLRFYLFTYPELHLVNIGFLLVIGRYTGYRLTELIRFRALAEETR